MSVVLDCSVALNWIMPDESSSVADNLLDRIAVDGGIVPPLFRIEVGNALLLAVRRKRIASDFCAEALERIGELPLLLDRPGADYVWTSCMQLAASHGLSLYDATYLELAKRLYLPLATLDARLAEAARRAGVASPWPEV